MAVYKVGTTGKAQSGLKKNDTVVTGGGTYKITGVNSDGTYKSSLVSKGVNTNTYTGKYADDTKTKSPSTNANNIVDPKQKAITYQTTAKTGYADNYMDGINKTINDYKTTQTDSQLASLRSAYDQQKTNLESQKSGIAQDATNLRNQVDTQYYTQGLPELYKAMEAGGQRGGENISGQVALAAARGTGRNNVDTYEANQNQAIAAALANLQSQQISDEAAVEQGISSDVYNTKIDAFKTAMGLQQKQQEQDRNDVLSTLGAYSNDYQARINTLTNDNDPSNDWQIPYLQSARNQKIATSQANQKAAEEKATAAATEATQTAIENGLSAWKISGYSPAILQTLLGIKPGTMAADYDIDKIQARLDQQKISLSNQKAAASSSSASNNTFPAIYSAMSQAPDKEAWLKENAPYMTNAELKYAQSLLSK
ncbi:MAG: hypothetical protein Q8873_00505 [Bacillota bacterium]|nr:hypothetical protein [Bacillota bacterium]